MLLWLNRKIIVFVLVLVSCVTPAQAALFSITKAHFSTYVDPADNYRLTSPISARNATIHRTYISHGYIYFSVTIVGGEDALRYLEDHQHLDLNVAIWGNGQKRDTVEIGIRPIDWQKDGKKLRSEFDAMGFFTWRTFMFTKQTWYSTIELFLFDDNNESVGPQGFSGSYNASLRILN